MTGAAPTPGPWEWDAGDIGQDYPAPYCDVFVDGGNFIIAQVNDRFSREIGHANARLIAAAPETAAERDRLVAALFKIQVITGDPIEGFESTIDACNELARAALAEARKP